MSSEVIDLVPEKGVFRPLPVPQKQRSLTKGVSSVKRGKIEYLPKEVISAILPTINNIRERLYCSLLWKTGMRVTESISLKKSGLGALSGRLTIRWLKSRKYFEREINVPKDLLEQLLVFSADMKQEDKLFPFSRQRAFQITKKYFGVSPHVFRHSFAQNWADQDLPVDVLRHHLGHKNIQTTLLYYQVTNKRAQECLLRLEWE